jgi:hypothetical protein
MVLFFMDGVEARVVVLFFCFFFGGGCWFLKEAKK